MHLLNHSCDPNCTVVSYAPDGWDNDLELLIFVATQKIRRGQQVTFHYRGNMWTPLELLPPTAPPGQRLIACGCNNPCPKRMGRLDYIEPRVRLAPETRAKWSRGCILDPESAPADLSDMSPLQVQNTASLGTQSSKQDDNGSRNRKRDAAHLVTATAVAQGPPVRLKQGTLDLLMMRARPSTLSSQIRTAEQNLAGLAEVWQDEQATIAPGSVCRSADADSSRHRFSKMSPQELLEHLVVLRAEDIDLDDALVDLRASQGARRIPSPRQNSESRFNLAGEQQQLRHVATCDFQGKAAAEISRDSISPASRMNTGLNSGIGGTSPPVLDADPEAVPSALKVIPSNALEAEQALRAFDCSARWGPNLSLTRSDRLARRRRYPGAPTGWEWVDDILRWFPALGKLRATERYCAGADTVSVMATSPA